MRLDNEKIMWQKVTWKEEISMDNDNHEAQKSGKRWFWPEIADGLWHEDHQGDPCLPYIELALTKLRCSFPDIDVIPRSKFIFLESNQACMFIRKHKEKFGEKD